LNGESSDEADGDALEVITLNKLIEIHAQKFEGKYKMLPENKLFFHSNDILFIFGVAIAELFKDFGFN
jgi:hypothetical protein